MNRILAVCVGALALLGMSNAQAVEYSAQVAWSESGHHAHGGVPAAFAQVRYQSFAFGANEQWSVQPLLMAGYVAPHDGTSQRGRHNVWLAGGGARVRHKSPQESKWFVEGAVLAAHGDTDELSGSVQFATTLGWSLHNWDVGIRHISNARIRQPNDGETMFVVGYNWGGE